MPKVCKNQLARILPLYILLQTFAVVIGNGAVNPLTPYWHLWYLLSYSIWLCLAWTWFRFCNGKGKIIILVCSVVIGCLAGLVPFIGRELSLSRTSSVSAVFLDRSDMQPEVSLEKVENGMELLH
jgi:hypothetical protein